MSLPRSFQFFANALQGMSRQRVRVEPQAGSTVKHNGTISFVLPSNSIVDLSTLELRGQFKFTNAVSTDSNQMRYVPQSHLLFNRQLYRLGGSTVSGQSNNNYGQVYEAMRRCCVGESYEQSNYNEYSQVPVAFLNHLNAGTDQEDRLVGTKSELLASDTQSRNIVYRAWAGLATSTNAQNFDTSIFGELRVELQAAGTQIIMEQSDAAIVDADVQWQLDNVYCVVDVISFSSSIYDELMGAYLSNEGQLLVPFNEITSQVSAISNSVKFNVSTQSLDTLCFAFLDSGYNQATRITSTSGIVGSGEDIYGPNHTKYSCRSSSGGLFTSASNDDGADGCNVTYYWMVDSQILPGYGAENIRDSVEATQACFSAGTQGRNLLFKGAYHLNNTISAAGGLDPSCPSRREGYIFESRADHLENNAIVCHKLCLDSPAAENERHAMSGKNLSGASSTLTLNLQNAYTSDSILIWCSSSAVLAASAGQMVSVTY